MISRVTMEQREKEMEERLLKKLSLSRKGEWLVY